MALGQSTPICPKHGILVNDCQVCAMCLIEYQGETVSDAESTHIRRRDHPHDNLCGATEGGSISFEHYMTAITTPMSPIGGQVQRVPHTLCWRCQKRALVH